VTALALALLVQGAAGAESLLVVEKAAECLAAYDPMTGRALWSVRVGTKPHEMALAADGRTAYVTNYGVDNFADEAPGGHTISIVDLVRRESRGEIDLGETRRPHGIEVGRSGRLYVSADQPPSLLVVDPASRAVVRRYPVGQSLPHMVAVSRDERRAFTANSGSASVSLVALDRDGPARPIEIGGVPMGFEWSLDGRRLFATNRTGNALVVIDPDTARVVERVEIPGQPVRLRLAPDGIHLLVSTIEAGDLVVVDTRDWRIVQRFHAGARAEGVAVDGAGRFGYVSSQNEDKIVKFSLADWKPVLEIRTRPRPDPVALVSIPAP
jgi:YVTN family beta-propeller protein